MDACFDATGAVLRKSHEFAVRANYTLGMPSSCHGYTVYTASRRYPEYIQFRSRRPD